METGHGGPEPAKENGLCSLGSREPLKGFEEGSDFKKRLDESDQVGRHLRRCSQRY